jgi:hypothetical protein
MATKNSVGKQRTNHHRGIKRAQKEQRRKEAEERAAKWAMLSPKDQIAYLDMKLGVGVGAKKQRAKIAAKGMKAAFDATPARMGEAAVAAASDAKQKRAVKQAKKEAADKKDLV